MLIISAHSDQCKGKHAIRVYMRQSWLSKGETRWIEVKPIYYYYNGTLNMIGLALIAEFRQHESETSNLVGFCKPMLVLSKSQACLSGLTWACCTAFD